MKYNKKITFIKINNQDNKQKDIQLIIIINETMKIMFFKSNYKMEKTLIITWQLISNIRINLIKKYYFLKSLKYIKNLYY